MWANIFNIFASVEEECGLTFLCGRGGKDWFPADRWFLGKEKRTFLLFLIPMCHNKACLLLSVCNKNAYELHLSLTHAQRILYCTICTYI